MRNLFFIFSFLCFSLSVFFSCTEKEILANPDGAIKPDTSQNTAINIQFLGKLLFYDPILSGDKTVACVTCHHPDFGYTDGLDLSIGVNGKGLGPKRQFVSTAFSFTKRKCMTVINSAFIGADINGKFDSTKAPMFWDSRVNSLEEQALLPIVSDVEMRGNTYSEEAALDSVVNRLKNIPEYNSLFATVFGGIQPVSATNLSKAIAAFERSLTAMNSPFDRYQKGDFEALTDLEIRGMNAFRSDGCDRCHSGNMFSDYKLHTLSVPDNPKSKTSDAGENGKYAFRTPSLRNIRNTGPYMHSGVFKTLEEVIDFYRLIADEKSQNPNVPASELDFFINSMGPPGQKEAIVAFIKTLSDSNFDRVIPKSVPSKLSVGGNIQ
jgi:cytochrome c peroxidase